jgi:drug/metabolite transporter (DMT)-like permease
MVIYAIFGLGLVQMTYLLGISDGNAVAATVLQFLAPIILSFYLAIKMTKVPHIGEVTALVLAVGGTVLLLSNGKLGTLVVPLSAVGWGLGSAVASALNT